jgi:hypothetical protein
MSDNRAACYLCLTRDGNHSPECRWTPEDAVGLLEGRAWRAGVDAAKAAAEPSYIRGVLLDRALKDELLKGFAQALEHNNVKEFNTEAIGDHCSVTITFDYDREPDNGLKLHLHIDPEVVKQAILPRCPDRVQRTNLVEAQPFDEKEVRRIVRDEMQRAVREVR